MAEITDDSASNTGVGALLRASRVRIGEDLRDVALLLRIRYPYLEAIEGGRFEELPGQTYAVGFVRAYADHLGLDEEEVVRRFKAEVTGDEVSRTNLRFPTPIAEASVPGGAIVFIGLLIAILAYGAWYVSTSDENYLADLIEPIPERLAALVSSDKSSKTLSPEPSTAADLSADTEPALVMPLEEMATSSRKSEMHADETAPTAIGETALSPKPQALSPVQNTPALAVEPTLSTSEPLPEFSSAASSLSPVATAAPVLNAPTGTVPPTEQAAAITDKSAESPSAPAFTETLAGSADDTSAIPAPAAPAPAPEPEIAASESEPEVALEAQAEPKSRVLVRAKSNSWIQVRDDFSNEILVTRLLKAGDEYHVPDKFGFRLLTGNAGALEILVDGKPVPPIGEEGAVRRGVQLDPVLLKAGNAVSD